MESKKIYSLYKGEKELAFGTIKEIANKMNVGIKTIRFYNTPTYAKRVKKGKNRRVLICTDEEK